MSGFDWKNGEVIFKWFPDFKAKMESYFGDWKSDPPKIAPIRLQDKLLCPVRAFKLYLKKRPSEKPDNPYRVWFVRKSALSCLVRDTIKASFRFDPRSQAYLGQLYKFIGSPKQNSGSDEGQYISLLNGRNYQQT